MPDADKSNLYQDSRKAWEEETLEPGLVKRAERPEKFMTTSSLPIERLYAPNGTEQDQFVDEINFPGQYPFTRGVHATGYRGKLWTMRMFAGFGLAEETNQRFKYLLSQGQTGLSIAFDMPTLYGYDTDAP
ncbi:MAG: methylmalonyl-CoA mutase, partial [Anaerolineae bacterium]|nr:methylmalonyl-CoA mutase [Anaerolineae bacterium]